MPDHTLESLRDRIRQLDRELVAKAAERVALAREVGELKRAEQRPVVDFAQERVVLDRARQEARALGLDPRLAEDLFVRLIEASVRAQDEDSLRLSALGAGRQAVIVGGAGRMGRWFGRFLSTLGYSTLALDPAAPAGESARAEHALPDADLVMMATAPATIATRYLEWAESPPSGLVVDIASIKSPLVGPIQALRDAGGRVASIHPMFGPSTVLLRDVDVVVCDTGDAATVDAVERLFQPTTANLVRIPLAEHDRIMADLLSLAHATAIAFALALPDSAHAVRSTTFQALESLASSVVRESPDVYFEIQARNPYSGESLTRLRDALDRIVGAVVAGDAKSFHALFREGERRTQGGESPRRGAG